MSEAQGMGVVGLMVVFIVIVWWMFGRDFE